MLIGVTMKNFNLANLFKLSQLLYKSIVVVSLSSFGVFGSTTFLSAIAAEACVRTNQGDIVCGTLIPEEPTENSAPETQTIESYGVKFELQGCKKSDSEKVITCEFLMTNTQKKI
jgi:hypothetical protein